jgi:xanthine dehydrogenase molybdopterin-binding subunit B
VEGAFVFGIGFFLTEEIVRDAKGKLLSDGTWTYKPPTIDTIPREFNVELFKSPAVSDRVLSSKGKTSQKGDFCHLLVATFLQICSQVTTFSSTDTTYTSRKHVDG